MTSTHLTHLIIVFDQRIHRFDGQEAVFIHAHNGALVFEDVGRDNGGKVVCVHLAATLFVYL